MTVAAISTEKIKKKLAILADAAKYDASCSSSGGKRKRAQGGMGNSEGTGICHSYAPDGRCISLLKILLTNFCIYDCKFCVNRVSSDTKRAKFTTAEVIWLTLEFYRRNYIEGLFLSSGIFGDPDTTMLEVIHVAKTLRKEHRFNGYIHLKVVAGASQELINEAGKWADRVSANIEMPRQEDLDTLAPAKTIAAAKATMADISNKIVETKSNKKKYKFAPKFAPAGQSTQMVVGATPSTDQNILTTSETLYSKFSLRRVYYSAYSPIPNADAILPGIKPSLVREHRLYQADWLLRFYGFKSGELFSTEHTNLSLDMDPKTFWALNNRHLFPVDINKASREWLLRVPGIGARNAERIIKLRRFCKVRLVDLQKMRVVVKRAKYFIITSDHNPDVFSLDSTGLMKALSPPAKQMSLFDQMENKVSAVSGEM